MEPNLRIEVLKKIITSLYQEPKLESKSLDIPELLLLFNSNFEDFSNSCDFNSDDLVEIMELLKENNADPEILGLKIGEKYFSTQKKMIDLKKIEKEGIFLREKLKKLDEIEQKLVLETEKLDNEQKNSMENNKINQKYQEDFFLKKIEGEKKKIKNSEEINWKDLEKILVFDENYVYFFFSKKKIILKKTIKFIGIGRS